jgi:hypothetical protein
MRFTRVALYINALLHGTANIGMALGLGPHAAEEPNMGRRAAAAGIAAAFMLVFVATRLGRDPFLILMPLVFVFCELSATLYDLASSRDASNLAPAVPEATFLILYALFTRALLRARSAPLA